MKNKKTIRDLILVAAILIVSGGFYLGNRILNQKPAAIVEVSLNGHVIEELDLKKDTEIVIQGYKGGTNTLIIKDGIDLAGIDEQVVTVCRQYLPGVRGYLP